MRALAPSSTAAWVLACGALLGLACGDDARKAEQKALLRPVDPAPPPAATAQSEPIFDDEGELMPSGEQLAGLELPRGVKVYRTLEQEVYLDAPGIVLEKLDRFFAPRLEPLGVSRTLTSVTYERARIKAAQAAPQITLRIARVNHGPKVSSDLMLRSEAAPKRTFPSEAELQQRLAEMRKYAD